MRKILLILILFCFLNADFPNSKNRYVLIQTGTLNLREKPKDGKVIGSLQAGEIVTILEDAKDDITWKKIKTKSGLVGFASNEFLGYFPPEEIQKAKLIGVLGGAGDKTNKMGIRVLAAHFSGQWYGFDDSADFVYLLNLIAKGKKSLDIQYAAKKVNSFQTDTLGKYGCQEFRGLEGRVKTPVSDTFEKSYIATYNFSDSKLDYTIKEDVSADITSNVLKEAISVFKKNKVTTKELENITEKKIKMLSSGSGKSYLVARYAIKNGFAERHYLSLVAELGKNNSLKFIHSKFETLEEERGNYGGSYHFSGIVDIDDTGVPALLFFHIGFDSGIYELFKIGNDKIESVFMGGGDAC
ncbi:MAG TPA: SH3 domain-containing protein [Leptospiraceae bacterium]|nr:SH3 domain-containing protein [Leptospiraceae bacterium]HNN80802.1 SH3 domain-containing protein [Leptospiraceae bacterium]